MDDFTKTFNRQIGKRLRDARVLRGLSQEQLGAIVGVSFQQIQKYEKGLNGLSPARMKQFAESVDVTINHLYGVTDMEMPQITASRRKLLLLVQALQQLEKQRPATLTLLYDFIVGLAKGKDG
jgi:transcriptional regulator with XRE-family HTH domain